MTALPQHQPAPPAPHPAPAPVVIDQRQYVDLSEAAQRLGLEKNHLGRLCNKQLASQGLAVKAPGPDGGSPRWWIHRSCNPRLLDRLESHEFDAADFDRFSGKQKRQAMDRVQCVERLRHERLNRPGKMKDWLPALLAELRDRFPELCGKSGKITRRSLYRWDRALGGGNAGLVNLINDRGGDTRSKGDETAWAYFEDQYIDQRKPMLTVC